MGTNAGEWKLPEMKKNLQPTFHFHSDDVNDFLLQTTPQVFEFIPHHPSQSSSVEVDVKFLHLRIAEISFAYSAVNARSPVIIGSRGGIACCWIVLSEPN